MAKSYLIAWAFTGCDNDPKAMNDGLIPWTDQSSALFFDAKRQEAWATARANYIKHQKALWNVVEIDNKPSMLTPSEEDREVRLSVITRVSIAYKFSACGLSI
jgi:hypothetical protein